MPLDHRTTLDSVLQPNKGSYANDLEEFMRNPVLSQLYKNNRKNGVHVEINNDKHLDFSSDTDDG
jgi:hypothetical protein